MNYLGDYDLSAVIYGMFNTFNPASGALVSLTGSGAGLVVIKNNGATESAAGVSLTIDFDARTGCHSFNIDTSADGTFYSSGGAFSVIINAGMAGAVSLAGAVVGSFSLRKDSALKPTVAARTLDVSAGGEAGLDWANIGSPTTAVNLSGTNIDVDQVVASVSGAVGSVTGNVGGNVTGSVGTVNAFAANSITAAATAADYVTEMQAAAAAALTAYDPPTFAELSARTLVSADYATSAALAVVDGLIDGIDLVTDKLDGMLTLGSGSSSYKYTELALSEAPSGGGSLTVQQIVDGVWDEPMANHLDGGSTGASLNGAGSAGDPWTTALPGAYGAGTAGNILGTNLDATVSSRASAAALAIVDGEVGDVLADTAAIDARLPSDPADASVIAAATSAILTAVDGVPTTAEFNARTLAAADYATAANLATVDTVVDAILVDTAEIGAAGAGLTALASAANLAIVDATADSIKLKTDQLTFGATNTVNANVTHVIADPVQQNGSTATEWGGAP